MDPKEGREAQSAGETDDRTVAAAAKRLRRVSFAETTAVHIFDRDEDFETPPESRLAGGEVLPTVPRGEHLNGGAEDDSRGSEPRDGVEGEDEEEGEEEEERFVRDMDSSSPGSTIGSVISNDDDDNFFGPVSTSFIRSGRSSDAGMSEDSNHDITLDSTAFSLHFHNFAPPDDCSDNSAGSLRTPTGCSDSACPAVPKGSRFGSPISNSLPSDGKVSDSISTSNDMSLVMEKPSMYDYEKMDTTLQALLSEVNRCLQSKSPSKGSEVLVSCHGDKLSNEKAKKGQDCGVIPISYSIDDGFLDVRVTNDSPVSASTNQITSFSVCNDIKTSPCRDTSKKMCQNKHAVSPVNATCAKDEFQTDIKYVIGSSSAFSESSSSIIRSRLEHNSANTERFNAEGVLIDYSNSSPVSALKILSMAAKDGKHQPLESESCMFTPKNTMPPSHVHLHGSVSALRSRHQHLFSDLSGLCGLGLQTSIEHTSLEEALVQHSNRISAIKNSISKFDIREGSVPITQREFFRDSNSKSQIDASLNKVACDHNVKDADAMTSDVETTLTISQMVGNQETSEISNKKGFPRPKEYISCCQSPKPVMHVKKNVPVHENVPQGISFEKEGFIKAHVENQSIESLTKCKSFEGASSELVPVTGASLRPSSLLEDISFMPSESFIVPSAADVQNVATITGCCLTDVSQSLSDDARLSFAEGPDICMGTQKDYSISGLKSFERDATTSVHHLSGDGYTIIEESSGSLIKYLAGETDQNPPRNSTLCHESGLKPTIPIHVGNEFDSGSTHGHFSRVEDPSFQNSDLGGRKRSIEEVYMTDRDQTVGTIRMLKSPKLLPKLNSTYGILSNFYVEGNDNHGKMPSKHRDNNFSKIFDTTLMYTLSIEQLRFLEGILDDLHKVRHYERVFAEMRKRGHSIDHNQRLAEARSLQDKLLFEQAKLQLHLAKLNGLRDFTYLQNKAQFFQTRIQECCGLVSALKEFSARGTIATQSIKGYISSASLLPKDTNQGLMQPKEQEKVSSMSRELESLEQKLKHFLISFEASFKIKGNLCIDSITKFANGLLKTMEYKKIVCQALRLWDVRNIVNKEGHCEIDLNYRDLLSQRFIVEAGKTPSILVDTSVHEVNIEKMFPHTNANTAFEFVFNVKHHIKLHSGKSFPQQTLSTSTLLGTLLEVIEEIQEAKMELPNLVVSIFHTDCSGRLDLQLTFLSLCCPLKATLYLDMTDMKWAVYPVKTSQLNVRLSEVQQHDGRSPSISDEITQCIQSVRTGPYLISRLCRKVAGLVRSASSLDPSH